MNKALVRLCPILLLIVLLITSCNDFSQSLSGRQSGMENSQSDKNRNRRITLKLWHIWVTDSESNKKPFEKALGDWNREHPDIQITADATENETYKTKIRTAMAVNEAPDIFYSWGAGFAKPFADSGKVLALDGYLDAKTRSKLLPGTLENFTYNGKIYGLPIYMIAGVLYCNTELFADNNIRIPETYDGLIAAVKALRKAGVTPMAVGEKDGWTGMFYQNILAIRTAGTKLTNQALNGKASFIQPEFVESAQRLSELIKAGAFDSRCMSMTRDEAEAQFRNGRTAMYYNGSWVAGTLDRDDSPVKGKIAVRNFPVIENSKGDPKGFLGGAIDTFMVSSGTQYPKEAINALIELDENFCRESYLSGAGIPAWKLDTDAVSLNPLAGDIAELVKDNTGFVLAWDTVLTGSEVDTHINLVADIFSGRLAPGQFAAEMQKINDAR